MACCNVILVFTILLVKIQVGFAWDGFSYWNGRYSADGISYTDLAWWQGYWNDGTNGRHAYGRTNQGGQSCGSCTCSGTAVDCSAAVGAV